MTATTTKSSQANKAVRRRNNRQRNERISVVIAAVLIAAVWILGAIRSKTDLLPYVQEAMPDAHHVEQTSEGIYKAWADAEEETLLGHVGIGTATGYGGELKMAVAVDTEGVITGVSIISHKESPTWYSRVVNRDFLGELTGKSYSARFQLGEDLDGISGATFTTRAMAQAALQGSQLAADTQGLPGADPNGEPPSIQFGVPEITVLALFAVGWIGHRRNFKHKKLARWGTMLVGLLVLGFLYNLPLTLAYITKLLLGFWPDWQTNLYWYFLLGGILFVVTSNNKNPYCEWFCPFGAAQECMAAIGGARVITLKRWDRWLKWGQRLLALAAVLLGIYFRSPGLSSFEIFGSLFSFVGSNIQFAVLAAVLLAALFIKRPWCKYLCPLDPVVDFIRVVRKWIKELWQKANPLAKSA